ncbi:putative transcriptional regulator [Candidatus Nitrososphaera evergladensis SR1]|jgi:predicted transcriptional regulator|uniref:Putative transcriptional regulator n=1 Tax=Candidatus Nitrososphaera evergladensis SR1 TaxID=1459636 RepID=A0A075MQI0_9ARCH|nr:winged helix-turn-helix domain-containing protein [Candidatus Nitrososphaera evergladensis]AIF83335.1 putative transcriptional regulator [Candidatus Nitrososphaera evergladensis SR1]
MKFRSRVDIAAEILDAAKDGQLKTRIMYESHTSVKQLNPYLDLLIESELLEYLPEERIYRTTEKGNRFLDGYQKAWHILFYAKSKKASKQEEAVSIVSSRNNNNSSGQNVS